MRSRCWIREPVLVPVVVCGLVWLSWACGVACFILAWLWQNKATRALYHTLSLVLFVALLLG